MGDNPRHKFGPHKYGLEEFELSFEDIDRAFAPYIADNRVVLERGGGE
jgi:hypothetical protein